MSRSVVVKVVAIWIGGLTALMLLWAYLLERADKVVTVQLFGGMKWDLPDLVWLHDEFMRRAGNAGIDATISHSLVRVAEGDTNKYVVLDFVGFDSNETRAVRQIYVEYTARDGSVKIIVPTVHARSESGVPISWCFDADDLRAIRGRRVALVVNFGRKLGQIESAVSARRRLNFV